MEEKKISVVVCTYNGEKFLKEQLDTIVSQTYPIYELIIQDDLSTDGTMEILRQYEQKYPFVHVFCNEERKGINLNFFTAMERASGDFIAISDQDDRWIPEKIAIQVASIGEYLLSAGFSQPFSDTEENIQTHFDNRMPNIGPERIIYVSMMAGHTMMFRKELIDLVPSPVFWSQYYLYDHLIQLVAAAYESIQFCPEVLVFQRKHMAGATYLKPENYKKNVKNILDSTFRTFKLFRQIRPEMKTYFAQTYSLLDSIAADTEAKKNAMKLARYQSKGSFAAFINLSLLCVRLRNRIFHTKENNSLLAVLRALYFPVSGSDYFRYLSKPMKK